MSKTFIKTMLPLCFVCLTSAAQSTSKNYVLERRMLDASESRSITAINYYDDLGYPEETATNGLSGNGKYAFALQSSEKTTDEDGCSVETFTDLYGHKVLERRSLSNDTDGELLVSVFYHSIEGLVVESKETLPGKYAEGNDMSQNKDRYSENILSYSPNGSIEKLQRYGKKNNATFGLIDDLTYSYNGNQIKAISDKAGSLLYNGSFDFKDGANADTEYFYDANGALTKDLNKGISNIEYDILGNLKCITFGNGNKTKYVYDASGAKLRTIHESAATSTTDYAGNFIFENGRLSKYLFEGGFCLFDSSLKPTYHYYEKDHLGSIRMVVNESGAIEQVNHYYPFGGILGDLSYNSEFHRNKYIGKELDHTDGLDWYDHGARMYDAAKGSWDRMDRKSEEALNFSTYIYSNNLPLLLVDLDGKRPTKSEAALIAKHVYGDYVKLTGGWSLYDKIYKRSNGLQYGLYYRELPNGKMDYVLAFAGTNSIDDVGQDVNQALGTFNVSQFGNAKALGQQFKNEFNDGDQTFVGHSLGGGLAAVASLETGIPAITFNPAALSKKTKVILNLTNKNNQQIINYIIKGEILDLVQKLLGLQPEGLTIKISNEKSEKQNCIKKHFIDSVIDTLK